MSLIKIRDGHVIVGTDDVFFTAHSQWGQIFGDYNWYNFTPIFFDIEWDKKLGGIDITFVLLGIHTSFRWNYNPEPLRRMAEEADREMSNGEYYFFVKSKNKLLKEFADYMEDHEDLRFWQALFAWTGAKKIEVNGEDPFHWEEKIVNRD